MSGSLRLPVAITTEDLPIERLVGPFFFDLRYFGSTLVRGNSRFGVFNEFPTHPGSLFAIFFFLSLTVSS